MSKVFSISLTTILMLVSLMGPTQPVSFTGDTPLEMNPVSDEIPLEDPGGGEEAVQEQEPESIDPPAEEAPLEANQEELAPADTPDQTANSPPAGDDSDAEQASDDLESSMVVAPNAVNPDPGTCGGIGQEPCPGGGGEVPQKATVLFAAVVFVNGVENALTNATIEVFDDSGISLGAQVTGEDGVAQYELTVGKTYTFTMSAEGYQSLSGLQVTVTAGMETVAYALELLPGTASFTVIDRVTGAPIEFASVLFSDNPDGDYQGETDENGVVSFASLQPGTYSFTVSAPGYAPQVVTVTVASGQTTAITIELAQAGDQWVINITNKVTGAPVASASIWIESVDTGDQFAGNTNSNGTWTSPRIADGDYIISIHHDDYVNVEDLTVTKVAGTPGTVQMQPYLEGRLALKVVDSQTGFAISNAQVTLAYAFQPVAAVYGKTNIDGEWTSTVLPGGEHQLSVHADGYIFIRATVTIVDGTTSFEVKLQPRYYGNFSFKVLDEETNRPVVNANVTITLRGGYFLIGSGHTDSNGNWQGPTTGWAEYQFTIEKLGYKTVTQLVYIEGKPFSRTIHLERGVSHDINVSVSRPAVTGSSTLLVQPIAGTNPGMMPNLHAQTGPTLIAVPGARVTLIDPSTNEELHAGETGEDGTVVLSNVYEGRYRMVVSASGMETHIQEVTVGDGSTFEVTMDPAQTEPPTDPDPGDGDPGDGEPGDGEPGDGEPGDGEPGDGEPGDGSNPDTGNPDNGSNPGTGNPNQGSNPGTGGDESGDDDDVAESGDVTNADPVAQTSGTSSGSASGSVNQLPNTGTGESNSHVGIATLTVVAAFVLLSALGIRRTSR